MFEPSKYDIALIEESKSNWSSFLSFKMLISIFSRSTTKLEIS